MNDLTRENKAVLDPMLPMRYKVVSKRRDTLDTYSIEVAPVEDDDRTSFAPGQFNMLYAFGVGEVPISISSRSPRNGNIVHTVRSVGAVTESICRLKKGDMLGLRGPFGTHWPVEDAIGEDIVILAGGIGLAPLRPTIHQIIARRDQFGKVYVLYGARSSKDMLYTREHDNWRRQSVEVITTVDRADDQWKGNIGVVTSLIQKASFDRLNTIAMICGPEVMMRFTIAELNARGLGSDNIYVSMERNMKCAIGFCGHCQYGPNFICKDGPVFQFSQIRDLFGIREV